jgi:hypothetical protein
MAYPLPVFNIIPLIGAKKEMTRILSLLLFEAAYLLKGIYVL